MSARSLRSAKSGSTSNGRKRASSAIPSAKAAQKRRVEATKSTDVVSSTALANVPGKALAGSQKSLVVREEAGDLFDSLPHSILLHACNTRGSWSAGIAATFKKRYPSAYKIYVTRCETTDASSLLGTAQLIPPQLNSSNAQEKETQHWVACLFTSVDYGRKKGSKESIAKATGDAMRDLVHQVAKLDKREAVGDIRMPRINAGLFAVPWVQTLAVLEEIAVPEDAVSKVRNVVVMTPPEGKSGGEN